jgi:cellulose biosynthesis protein BcsQ
MKEDKAESLLVISAKDGAGKTFLTANLGAALAKRNEKAAIIDLSGTGDASMFMGLYDEPDIVSIKELHELDEYEFKRHQNSFSEKNLTVISFYPPHDEEEINYLKEIILRLKKERQYIIIDGEMWPFIDKICERVLIVALPNPINLRLTKDLIDKLKPYKNSNNLYVVLNKIEKRVYRGTYSKGLSQSPQGLQSQIYRLQLLEDRYLRL